MIWTGDGKIYTLSIQSFNQGIRCAFTTISQWLYNNCDKKQWNISGKDGIYNKDGCFIKTAINENDIYLRATQRSFFAVYIFSSARLI